MAPAGWTSKLGTLMIGFRDAREQLKTGGTEAVLDGFARKQIALIGQTEASGRVNDMVSAEVMMLTFERDYVSLRDDKHEQLSDALAHMADVKGGLAYVSDPKRYSKLVESFYNNRKRNWRDEVPRDLVHNRLLDHKKRLGEFASGGGLYSFDDIYKARRKMIERAWQEYKDLQRSALGLAHKRAPAMKKSKGVGM